MDLGNKIGYVSTMWPWLRKKARWEILPDDSLGTLGEKLGCRYLEKKGYKIVETNYKNPQGRRLGEIDIIATIGKKIVFVEVKTREKSGLIFGLPEANINREKLHKLQKIAAYYLRQNKRLDREYAFDALSIVYDGTTSSAKIRHLESIFL